MDTTRKKKIIDIESTKGRINDILTQLRNTDCGNSDSEFLLMPWNYVIKQFESEAEERSRIWEEEKSKDFDERLNNLESKMDKKHNELLSSIRNMLNEVDLGKKSGQVSFSTPVPAVTVTQPSHGHVGYPPTYAGVAAQQPMGYSPRGSGAHLSVSQGVPRQGGGRSRSPSIKRFRNEDGSTTEVNHGTQNAAKKGVVGTSNPATSGRKMRSPPAAIFVWGVHPETTIDDIINDLAESDLKVEAKDIVKKSKDEAYLVSYKINIPGDDLAKALNPDIWPIGVRVREFIHYKRKPGRAQQDGLQQEHGGHGHQQVGREQYQVQQNLASHQYGRPFAGNLNGWNSQHVQQEGQPAPHVQIHQGLQGIQQQKQLYPNLNNMFGVLSAPGAPNPNL